MSSSFNVGDFVIQFQSIIDVPELSESFLLFLKKEHSYENWEFILTLKNFEKLLKKKNQKVINKEFLTIVDTFLAPKSSKELEILPQEKKIFLEKIKTLKKDEWSLSDSPLDILEPFRKAILVEYKNDSYKRYIRTEECLKVKKIFFFLSFSIKVT